MPEPKPLTAKGGYMAIPTKAPKDGAEWPAKKNKTKETKEGAAVPVKGDGAPNKPPAKMDVKDAREKERKAKMKIDDQRKRSREARKAQKREEKAKREEERRSQIKSYVVCVRRCFSYVAPHVDSNPPASLVRLP